MVPALAFLAMQTPFPTQEVSLRLRAARVPVVLQKLSEKAGAKFAAAPALENDVVLVSTPKVTTDKLMVALAEATTGKWVQEGETWTLTPDITRRRAEEQTLLVARVNRLRKAISDQLVQHEKSARAWAEHRKAAGAAAKAATGDDEDHEMVGPPSPETPLIGKILLASDLTPVARGERMVFASDPTGMQYPLGGAALQAIRAFTVEHDKTLAQAGPEMTANDFDGVPPEMVEMIRARQPKPVSRFAKVLLTIGSQGGFMGMSTQQAKLRFYDGNGKLLTEKEMYVGNGRDEDGAAGGFPPPAAGQAPNAKPENDASPKIVASAETAKFEKAFESRGLFAMRKEIDPALLAKLKRPDVDDPLSLAATDVYFAYADALKRPVVALVPDQLGDSEISPDTYPRLSVFTRRLQPNGALRRIDTEGGVTVVVPKYPAEAREDRVSRADLARMIAEADAKGSVTLESLAGFAWRNPDPITLMGSPLIAYMALASGMINPSIMGMPNNWDHLRLWAALPANAKSSPRNVVALGSLAPPAQNVLRKILFSGATSFSSIAAPPPIFMEAMMGDMLMGGGDITQEPTQIMPRGVPREGQMELTKADEPALAMRIEGMAITFGLDEMAFFRMMMDQAKDRAPAEIAQMTETFGKPRRIERTAHLVRVLVAPGKVAVIRLSDDRIPSNAATVDMLKLPDDMDKLVAERVERLKQSPWGKMMLSMGGFGGGGSGIKP